MFNPSFYVGVFCFVSLHLSFVRSECLITYPDDRKLMPRYTRPMAGLLHVPYNSLLPISVADGEVIDVYCLTKIKTFYDEYDWSEYYKKYNSEHRIEDHSSTSLVCEDGTLKWKPDGHKLVDNKLSCEPIQWSLYYDVRNRHCGIGQFSYTLGTSFEKNEVSMLAQLCYDYKNYMPTSLSYIMSPTFFLGDHNVPPFPRFVKNISDVGTESKIVHMTHLRNEYLENAIFLRASHNPWLQLANYEFHSLGQGQIYQTYFHEYKWFLDIPWWKNLRHGNWRRVMEALDEQVTSKTFNVTSGISGVAPVPHEGCSKTRHLHLIVKGVNVTVPEYVWTYIQPVGSDLDSFVVIGYNSPYFKFFPRDTTMLCQDICHTIDWLKDIRYSFNKTTAGIVFCCDPNEIQKGNLLEGFPAAPVDTDSVEVESGKGQTDKPIGENEFFLNRTYER